MAWFISEVTTDAFLFRSAIQLYGEMKPESIEDNDEKIHKVLADFLRASDVDTDHINIKTIPEQYERDEYKWLAVDMHQVLQRLALIKRTHLSEDERISQYVPTELGEKILNDSDPVSDVIRVSLNEWKNSRGIKPYLVLKDVLAEFKEADLYPCDGLLLLEVLCLLLDLDKRSHFIEGYPALFIRRIRYQFYATMTGDKRIDIVRYSDFLWEEICSDSSTFHDVDYLARSTLLLMMHSGELAYGDIPDDIFGLAQYITVV